ncbi:MAG: ABC transporter permease [Eubacterium sp.]|nr:ABC transporter permease [Eubacterium sp.]
MIILIRNEFYKQKREWSLLFLLLLSLLPVLTGGAGAVFHGSTKTLASLFFFMNNQFAMFFPMALFVLAGFLFYQEYKNKTYINWITYGYPKYKLFFTKVLVALIIGTCFALILLLLFICLIFGLQMTGTITADSNELLAITIGFLLEAAIIIPVTVPAGAIVINLSRNMIVTSVTGVIYGFVSCFFIGSEIGFIVPNGFAYRVALYFSDQSSYYDNPVRATIGGSVISLLVFLILLLIGAGVFAHKRKIES